MHVKPYQKMILKQYRMQETLLSRLYSVFARQFPEYKEFWENIAAEEVKHAQLIDKLSQAAVKGLVLFDEGKVKIMALDTFISRLEKLIEAAGKGEFIARQAFTIASDYETSLIEKDVFKRFNAFTEKSKTVLRKLNSETQEHIERVNRMQKELRL